MTAWTPAIGETVRDTATNLVGEFRGQQLGRCFLRPLGGGKEWSTKPTSLRPISQTEVLSARVGELNRQHRRGQL